MLCAYYDKSCNSRALFEGLAISKDDGSFQNDMTNIVCKDDVLTLMVHLGYLAYAAGEEAVYIPNEEVRQEFVLAVTKGRHKELAKLIRNSDQLLMQTLDMNEAAAGQWRRNVYQSIEAHSRGDFL